MTLTLLLVLLLWLEVLQLSGIALLLLFLLATD